MTKDQYLRISDYVNGHPLLKRAILSLNIILTGIGFISYPAFLIFFSMTAGLSSLAQLTRGLIIYSVGPALLFLLVTIYRKKKDRKRPYEYYGIQPLIEKDKRGQSFPSRHIFSFAMIAVLWYPYSRPVSIALLLLCFLLALIRLVGGVHFIKDLAAGAVIGILAGSMIHILYMGIRMS